MNENKTEKPTRHKIQKAKLKGEVPKSSSLSGATVFIGGVFILWLFKGFFASRFRQSMLSTFSHWDGQQIEGALSDAFKPLLFPILLIMISVLIFAVLGNFLQTGWVWAVDSITLKWRPKKKEKRIVFPLLQFGVISFAGYFILKSINPFLISSSASKQADSIFGSFFFTAFVVGGLLLFLGIIDFMYQKWRFYRQMHMTSREKREEQRESEGSPQIKSHRRNKRD